MAARSAIFTVFCVLMVSICFLGLYYSPMHSPGMKLQALEPPPPKPYQPCVPGCSVSLFSPEKDEIRIGDLLHYLIISYECGGNGVEPERPFGGEFWSATLASASHPRASTAGHITDHFNGTYSVYFYAGWVGKATVSVTRVLSNGAVDFLREVIWPAEDRVVWQGYFKTKEIQDITEMPKGLCKLRSHGSWTGMCEYPHPKALGKTVFICEKPIGVASCDTLYATKSDGNKISAKVNALTRGREQMYQRSEGFRNRVQIAEPTITILDSSTQGNRSTLPKCVPDQELPVSHGYWIEGHWHSLICKINDWTETPKLTSCLRNKNLILLGDSTTRQWFIGIHVLLGIVFIPSPKDRHFTWHRHYEYFNATIFYSAHPQLVGSLVVYLDEVNYEVDILDGLTNSNCEYIVLVSPWAHFSQWTRANYVDRTERLRDALVGFRDRCPGVKIVLKGPHAREHNSFESAIFSSDYILKEIGKINRRLLHGIGVWYLPVWAMNLAHPAPNTVHMPMDVIKEELRMFFSYVCDE